MSTDPIDLITDTAEAAGTTRERFRLNAAVAITVALLATFMGICKVKDDNIVQAIQQAQADKLDHWSFYQARNVRQEVAEATATQLRLQKLGQPATSQAAYDAAIARYDQIAKEQFEKKNLLKDQAGADQKNYDALNFHDDQFDLSDALLAIAISLLAITSLTQMWPLYVLSLLPAGTGVLMGLAGLIGWRLHPDAFVKLLS